MQTRPDRARSARRRPDRGGSAHSAHSARGNSTGGFTLVELLVVIAMIAVLISLVISATSVLMQTSRGLTCLANQRQMMLAWDGYATDNAGRYVAPDTNRHAWDWVRSVGNNMGPGNTEKISALTEGRLYPYVGDVRLYRSPVDESDPILRPRTYSLSAFFTDGEGTSDWNGPPSWSIGTRSRIPKPSETIAMVAEHDRRGHNINGWGINPYTPDWIDQLMTFDTGYFNFAFADGHVERYKWAGESYTDPRSHRSRFQRSGPTHERVLPRTGLGLGLRTTLPRKRRPLRRLVSPTNGQNQPSIAPRIRHSGSRGVFFWRL